MELSDIHLLAPWGDDMVTALLNSRSPLQRKLREVVRADLGMDS